MNLFLYETLVATVSLGYLCMVRDHVRENGGDFFCFLTFVLQGGPHMPFNRE